ncbi:hypothetical protein [Massilia sp. TN1-12]|uniref:hypothetical protein n=1 Tax=Massilia paldalensis TaxID=3377675 RepID=UPI00384D7050
MSTTTDTTDSVAIGASRPLPDWLKGALLAGCIFFACWAGAITWWRLNRSAPAGGELALYLLGVPSLLVLAFFVGHRLLGRSTVRTAAPAVAGRQASAQDGAAPAPHAATLAILGAAVRSAHGVSPAELAATLAAGTARADLDPELVDDDGFPIMSVRSPDARNEALQEQIADWLAHHGLADAGFGEEQWRALVLGSAVVEELAARAVAQLLPADGKPPLLRLAPLLPPDWSPDQRQAAAMWFEHLAERCGWPAAQVAFAAEAAPGLPIALPSVLLDGLARDAAAADAPGIASGNAPVIALVVACASHIGADSVARWSADGTLFTSAHPHGRIPGEGAAGLLLADLSQAPAIGNAPFALLEPLHESRRAISADETRRADASALGEAAERALARHGNGDGAVTRIVADTGHRSSRVIELMGFMVGSMPQLDEVDDAVRVGEACGASAAVPFITALAIASHHALDEEGPVLCISNEDPYRRSAALLQSGSISS